MVVLDVCVGVRPAEGVAEPVLGVAGLLTVVEAVFGVAGLVGVVVLDVAVLGAAEEGLELGGPLTGGLREDKREKDIYSAS